MNDNSSNVELINLMLEPKVKLFPRYFDIPTVAICEALNFEIVFPISSVPSN